MSTGDAGSSEPPIACTLPEPELRERRATLLDSVRRSALDITELPRGYAYRFDPATGILPALAQLMDLERRCCPFLTFTLIVEAGGGPIRLEITGPPAAKPTIADFFGSPGRE